MAKRREELAAVEEKRQNQRQIIYAKIVGDPSVTVTPEEQKVIAAVHQVFQKYDIDNDETLSEEEARPFIRNFAQVVLGMEPKVAYSEPMINNIYR